jgi:RNA polymerase sigma-70 factor, ECF subfamily
MHSCNPSNPSKLRFGMPHVTGEEHVAAAQNTDETLLQSIARHDVEALELLYARYAQTTYNVIMRIVRDSSVAEEVLQDTFWQVWRKAGEFRGGVAAAWLFRIARNKSLDQLRRQKSRAQAEVAGLPDEQSGWSPAITIDFSVEQAAEQAWRRQHVRRALGDIPTEQRRCLELAYFEGMTQREIADRDGMPVGTIKTRIRLGLEKLERVLRAAGLAAEDVEP